MKMIFERLNILERLHNIEEQVLITFSKYFKPNRQIIMDFIISLNNLGIPCKAISIFWQDKALKQIMGEITVVGISDNRLKWAENQLKNFFGRKVLLIDIFEKTKALPLWLKPPIEMSEQDKLRYLCNLYTIQSKCVINSEYLRQIIFETYGIDIQKGNIFYFPSYFQNRVFFDALFAFEQSPEGWEMLFIERLITTFINILHLSCRIYLNYIYALRSAIAAIMGRNMSHNVGSHAIWHLTERLENSGVYSNDDIISFLRYLQRRMDFIAQVSTSVPSWCLTMQWSELLNGFTKQICLLDNIARSHLQDPTNPSKKIFEEKLTVNREGKINLAVSIPHGQIGAQAFYIILEGLIRNAAKYGQVKDKLEFTITIEDQWNDDGRGWQKDFYQVKIRDNLTTKQKVVEDLNQKLAQPILDPETGELKTGDWGMKEIKISAAYLRMIRQEEIDTKFEEWKDGKGVAPPIVTVKLENERGEGDETIGNLTYVLYLLRSKEALIVGMEPSENPHNAFRQKGIDFLPKLENLKQQINEGYIPRHNFLVLVLEGERMDWEWLRDNLASLPYRILVVGKDTIPNSEDYTHLKRTTVFIDQFNLSTPEKLLCYLWEKWVEAWWGKYKICVRWEHTPKATEKHMEENCDLTCSEYEYFLAFDHKNHSDTTNLFRCSAFHQSFRSDSPTAVLLDEGNPYQIKEMAAISVAVIDERIWLERDGDAVAGVDKYKYAENKKQRKAWEKRRVYLQDTDEARKDFREFVNQLKPPNEDPYFDFIIIHQGIIDEVKKQLGENEFRRSWETLKSKARWVIIDTGRGEPEMARNERLRWVEYSNLAECLVRNAGDKMTLAHLLWALRFT